MMLTEHILKSIQLMHILNYKEEILEVARLFDKATIK